MLREPITRGAQEKPDVVEGIACAPAVTGRVLLDETAYLTWCVASEFYDVKGVEHAGCILGAGQAMASLLSLERGSSVAIHTRRASLFSARTASSCTRCQTCPAPGPTNGA